MVELKMIEDLGSIAYGRVDAVTNMVTPYFMKIRNLKGFYFVGFNCKIKIMAKELEKW